MQPQTRRTEYASVIEMTQQLLFLLSPPQALLDTSAASGTQMAREMKPWGAPQRVRAEAPSRLLPQMAGEEGEGRRLGVGRRREPSPGTQKQRTGRERTGQPGQAAGFGSQGQEQYQRSFSAAAENHLREVM